MPGTLISGITANPYLQLIERTEVESPRRSNFAMDGGKVVAKYKLSASTLGRPITQADLSLIPYQIVGTTDCGVQGTNPQINDGNGAASGALNRVPPMADACYPWLFADKYEEVGKGNYQQVFANPALEIPSQAGFALYESYEYTIEFVPRPYLVVGNNWITSTSSSCFNFNGQPVSYAYCNEYDRYITTKLEPTYDFVTAQQGSMVFVSNNLNNQMNVSGLQFMGSPRMPLGLQKLTVTWMGVPYRYISSPNSTIRYFAGYINQFPISIDDIQYENGELLYLGYNPTKFTPPVPLQQTDISLGSGGSNVSATYFATDKLCNVELHFLYTRRFGSDLPATFPTNSGRSSSATAGPIFDSTNPNYITQGHNLLPEMVYRKYHYAIANANQQYLAPGAPSFLSFPLESLFYDPDASGALQVWTATGAATGWF